MTVVELPVSLLAAIGRFCHRDPFGTVTGTPMWLRKVWFDANEIAACDGHRLARVSTDNAAAFTGTSVKQGARFALAADIVDAAVAFAQARRGANRIRIENEGDKLEIGFPGAPLLSRVGVVVLSLKPDDEPPDLDKVMVTSGLPALPATVAVNSPFMVDLLAVASALGESAITISGCGGEHGPLQIECLGARFVLMGMRR